MDRISDMHRAQVITMSDPIEALVTAASLLFSGVVLVVFSSALESMTIINLGFWGTVYVIVGFVLILIVIGALFASLFR